MKRIFIPFLILSVILLILLFLYPLNLLNINDGETKPFYVGVTYCGDSVEGAKLLVDKVKNYTNLFVLQSGTLQESPEEINEIGDYAVSFGMYFIVSFDHSHQNVLESWLMCINHRWGDYFLGVYYHDEPAGRMIDHGLSMDFLDAEDNSSVSIMYLGDGVYSIAYQKRDYKIYYESDGRIFKTSKFIVDNESRTLKICYYPNGTMTGKYAGNPIDLNSSNCPFPVDSYESLLQEHPVQTVDDAARLFTAHNEKLSILSNMTVTMFTADYVLHWFDYLAGYDVVFAELGWNNTVAQEIGLVRGAANLQNKSWGTIITWTYNHAPYLTSGNEIYEQMRTSYECGAQYVLIFNYALDMDGPYGTLQDEHFAALERFWKEVVQSKDVKHGSDNTEVVLVLPENYGWGMRNSEDTLWGLWGPDEKSQQIWDLSQNLLEMYGTGLDIVYDDSDFPVVDSYSQIYYWNQSLFN